MNLVCTTKLLGYVCNQLYPKSNSKIQGQMLTAIRGYHTPHHSLDHPPPRHHVGQLLQLASGILAPSVELVIDPLAVVIGLAAQRALQSVGPAIVEQPPVV